MLLLCQQCSLCLSGAAVPSTELCWVGTAGAGCTSLSNTVCQSAHFQCTSSFPFSQESFWISFTYPLSVFLFPAIKGCKMCWKQPHFVITCNLFLRNHTGGYLLFVFTSPDRRFMFSLSNSHLSVSYFACFVLVLRFMTVQKYSLTAIKFLKSMCRGRYLWASCLD